MFEQKSSLFSDHLFYSTRDSYKINQNMDIYYTNCILKVTENIKNRVYDIKCHPS